MATYYLATTGDDASDGLTIGTAWASIAFAVGRLSAGDVLVVLEGSYPVAAEVSVPNEVTIIGADAAGNLRGARPVLAVTTDLGSDWAMWVGQESQIVSLEVDGQGLTRNLVGTTSGGCVLVDCVVGGSDSPVGAGISLGAGGLAYRCRVRDCRFLVDRSTLLDCVGPRYEPTGSGGVLVGCVAIGDYGVFSFSSTLTCVRCTALNCDRGFRYYNNRSTFIECVAVSNAGYGYEQFFNGSAVLLDCIAGAGEAANGSGAWSGDVLDIGTEIVDPELADIVGTTIADVDLRPAVGSPAVGGGQPRLIASTAEANQTIGAAEPAAGGGGGGGGGVFLPLLRVVGG